MAWIESHQSLLRHPKMAQLIAALGTDRYKLIGHLHALWWWSLDVADNDGKLPTGTSDVAIADGAGWPIEDAKKFIKALRSAGFMEKRGYQLHDWDDYTWRYHSSKGSSSSGGTLGNHKRWHVNRGIVAPDCQFCHPESGGDSPDVSDHIGGQSHPPTQPSLPPNQPTDRPTEATPTGTAGAKPAAASPYNLSSEEWRMVIGRFPGTNVQALWHEWVGWVEESEERRKPDDKVAAFIGWLKKKTAPAETGELAAAGSRRR